jgi:hypothetical protein
MPPADRARGHLTIALAVLVVLLASLGPARQAGVPQPAMDAPGARLLA